MIGVLGGTFDPIHYGHLRPAQEAMRAARSGRAAASMPAGCAAAPRDAGGRSLAQRLHMVELAIDGLPGFGTDDRELRRGGPSYTVLTLPRTARRARRSHRCACRSAPTQLRGFERWHPLAGNRPAGPSGRARTPGRCEAGDWPEWRAWSAQTDDPACTAPANRPEGWHFWR
ncbi:MAG: adenylyltransferase/cytidyltransferase family protein [Chromatiales bacterium]|nr:adenylyltransferase/cytidyltransferase family protein [Chromatiales bacterium]